MKKFLASMVLVVSLVVLVAPVFAMPPSKPHTQPTDASRVMMLCPHCNRIIEGTQAECDAHIANCTGTAK